ncbi:hypothetical protein H6P81_001290 [Aristolochia fimbriata]|uniref:Uncharacterized protein n=1 Tax=Aristolochia fimbriata TaxID=158543 RepID=A0AAV7FAH4_ARIFI|nr:hypothetical protein H6P81_001290 [Aristolochia fimbriata]
MERSSGTVRKGAWSREEDTLLQRCILKFGEGNWHLVPERAGKCRKSCRLRWLNYLSPNIKRGIFSPDEIDLLIRLHNLLGNRWSLIAGRLPGRTANDVKNYWNTHQKKKKKQQQQQQEEEEEEEEPAPPVDHHNQISDCETKISFKPIKPKPRALSSVNRSLLRTSSLNINADEDDDAAGEQNTAPVKEIRETPLALLTQAAVFGEDGSYGLDDLLLSGKHDDGGSGEGDDDHFDPSHHDFLFDEHPWMKSLHLE